MFFVHNSSVDADIVLLLVISDRGLDGGEPGRQKIETDKSAAKQPGFLPINGQHNTRYHRNGPWNKWAYDV